MRRPRFRASVSSRPSITTSPRNGSRIVNTASLICSKDHEAALKSRWYDEKCFVAPEPAATIIRVTIPRPENSHPATIVSLRKWTLPSRTWAACTRRIFRSKIPAPIVSRHTIESLLLGELAKAFGLTVGRDLSLIRFVALEETKWLRPRLSTVDQKPYEIGRTAATLLLDRIEGHAGIAQPRSGMYRY